MLWIGVGLGCDRRDSLWCWVARCLPFLGIGPGFCWIWFWCFVVSAIWCFGLAIASGFRVW